MIETRRTEAKPRRWISNRYPKYVNEIADIYVEYEDINDRMTREIRGSIPEFSCTYDGIVSRRRGAECEAALKALRKIAADDGDMSRERHSMPTLRWGSASEGGATSEDARRDQSLNDSCLGRCNEQNWERASYRKFPSHNLMSTSIPTTMPVSEDRTRMRMMLTMQRRFGACIIDPDWHVAKRFRHVSSSFRTIVRRDSVRNHAQSCTIMHLWAVAPIVSVETRKIMHLWRLAHGVSVKCPAERQLGEAA